MKLLKNRLLVGEIGMMTGHMKAVVGQLIVGQVIVGKIHMVKRVSFICVECCSVSR